MQNLEFSSPREKKTEKNTLHGFNSLNLLTREAILLDEVLSKNK
jgi:hypothetical protein